MRFVGRDDQMITLLVHLWGNQTDSFIQNSPQMYRKKIEKVVTIKNVDASVISDQDELQRIAEEVIVKESKHMDIEQAHISAVMKGVQGMTPKLWSG